MTDQHNRHHDTATALQQDAHDTADDRIRDLTRERNEYLNGWKRALADYENFRRDSAGMAKELRTAELVEIIRAILPMIDNFDQALSHIPPNLRSESWAEGLTHVRSQWNDFMRLNNISKIEALDRPFDPKVHEAIGTEQHQDTPDQSVVSVASDGYLLDTALIRPARVTVNDVPTKQHNDS